MASSTLLGVGQQFKQTLSVACQATENALLHHQSLCMTVQSYWLHLRQLFAASSDQGDEFIAVAGGRI